MVCGSCVKKLAYKLLAHNPKLDLIRAFELAEKGYMRYAERVTEKVEPQRMVVKSGGGNPSDYSYPCTTPIFADCDMAGAPCYLSSECANLGYCRTTTCPAPLPNSHYVSKTCSAVYRLGTCNICRAEICGATGLCNVSGLCYYDCDAGYVWNPATSQCEVTVGVMVSKRLLVGVGL